MSVVDPLDVEQEFGTDAPTVARALGEPLFVCEDHPDALLDTQVVVYSEDREYSVDVELGFCDCPAFQYHHDDGERCKHIVRALVACGDLDVPAWVDVDSLDDQLLRRLDDLEEDSR